MATVGIPFHGAEVLFVVDGAFTFVYPVQPAQSSGSAERKKRSRGEDFLVDESEARGWSSSVQDRSLALRRRRGSASPSCQRGCVIDTDSQYCRGGEEKAVKGGIKVLDRNIVEGNGDEAPKGQEFFYITIL